MLYQVHIIMSWNQTKNISGDAATDCVTQYTVHDGIMSRFVPIVAQTHDLPHLRRAW
jgi:hypothetical protein